MLYMVLSMTVFTIIEISEEISSWANRSDLGAVSRKGPIYKTRPLMEKLGRGSFRDWSSNCSSFTLGSDMRTAGKRRCSIGGNSVRDRRITRVHTL